MKFSCILLLAFSIEFAPIMVISTTAPSIKPSIKPTFIPTLKPTIKPTIKPTLKPTIKPTLKPTRVPSQLPTSRPSSVPSSRPTSHPTVNPTSRPSSRPSLRPTSSPTASPTSTPTSKPTSQPSLRTHSHSHGQAGLSGGGIAGIVIAIFVVIAIGVYFARNHYNYIQRFINISGLSGYGFLGDTNGDSHVAKAKCDDQTETDTAGGIELFSHVQNPVDNPIWSAVDSPVAKSSNSPPPFRRGSDPSSPTGGDSPMDEEEAGDVMESVTMVGVSKAGFLMKRSTHKSWLRRWFFIKEGKMYYTHKPFDSATVGKKQIAAVPVANLLISTVRNASNKEFQIISPGQRGVGSGGGVYQLMADSEGEATEWVRVIKQQIEGSLTRNLPSLSNRSNSDGTEAEGMRSSSAMFVPGSSILKELRQANPTCVDCDAVAPDWASLNLCVMICIECSGIHRSLGSHISKVRSITLDKWSSNSIQLLKQVGNRNANAIWEASLLVGGGGSNRGGGGKKDMISSSSDRETRELFITRKYVKHAYLKSPALSEDDLVNSLLSAARTGDLLGIMRSLASGVDVNAVVVKMSSAMDPLLLRKTPLMLACEGDFPLCVELLCQWGASLDMRDSAGLTAGDIAAKRGCSDVMDVLTAFSSGSSGSSKERRLSNPRV